VADAAKLTTLAAAVASAVRFPGTVSDGGVVSTIERTNGVEPRASGGAALACAVKLKSPSSVGVPVRAPGRIEATPRPAARAHNENVSGDHTAAGRQHLRVGDAEFTGRQRAATATRPAHAETGKGHLREPPLPLVMRRRALLPPDRRGIERDVHVYVIARRNRRHEGRRCREVGRSAPVIANAPSGRS